jgi:DNA-binding PadR family transcriptional regulator
MVISSSRRHAPADEPGTLDVAVTPAIFQILLALAPGKAHGYGIMQDVAALSDGETRLGPGTLYRSIQRMLVDGLIHELAIALHDEKDDDRRRYYRLTPKGLAVAKKEALRLTRLADVARKRGLVGKRTGSSKK